MTNRFYNALVKLNLIRSWRAILAFVLCLTLILVVPWADPGAAALFFAPGSSIAAGIVLVLVLVGFTYRGRSWSVYDPRTWAIITGFYVALTNAWAASLTNSLQVTVIEVSALLVFVLAADYAHRWLDMLIAAFLVSGILIDIYGMGAAVNWWTATDAVYGAHLLASFFQYHNTFAAFELAVGVLGFLSGMVYKRWWMNALGILAFIIGIDAVVGSYSRTVWVLALVAYLASLLIKGLVRRSVWPVVTGILMGIAGAVTGLLALKALTQGSSSDFVISFLLAIVLSILLAYLDHWLSVKSLPGKWAAWGLGITVLVVSGIGYMLRSHLFHGTSSLITRLHSITFQSISLQERFYYYKDALNMWKSSPIFGSGGGTWVTKFQSFQTLPYWSEQVHSSFFDQLLNGGLIGLALFLVLAIFTTRTIILQIRAQTDTRNQMRFWGLAVAALFLLLHSLLDFDFAFGFYQYVFAIMLAMAVGEWQPNRLPVSGGRALRWSIAIGGIAAGAFSLVAAVSLGTSQILVNMMNNPTATVVEKQNLSQTALSFAPYNASLQLSQVQNDLQTAQTTQNHALYETAWKSLQAVPAAAPWDPTIQTQAAVIAYQLGQAPTALMWANQAVKDGRFNTTALRNLLGLTMWVSAGELTHNPVQGRTGLQKVHTIYANFINRSKQVNLTLFPDSVVMAPDASMQVYVATADCLLKNYRQSLQEMNPFLQANRDQAAVTLYEIDTVLDDAGLHLKNLADAVTMQQIQANPAALQEYNYLKGLLRILP